MTFENGSGSIKRAHRYGRSGLGRAVSAGRQKAITKNHRKNTHHAYIVPLSIRKFDTRPSYEVKEYEDESQFHAPDQMNKNILQSRITQHSLLDDTPDPKSMCPCAASLINAKDQVESIGKSVG
ncbi:11221_t:CDS:1, partial [Paraglomus occultum]